jgi:hypothetical protein
MTFGLIRWIFLKLGLHKFFYKKKSGRNLKIAMRRKGDTKQVQYWGPKLFVATVINLVARATWRTGFVYSCFKRYACDTNVSSENYKAVGQGFQITWQVTPDTYVARIGERRGVYRVLVGKPEGKRPLGRPGRRCEDYIKMDIQESECGRMGSIERAPDRDRWRALVKWTFGFHKMRGISW